LPAVRAIGVRRVARETQIALSQVADLVHGRALPRPATRALIAGTVTAWASKFGCDAPDRRQDPNLPLSLCLATLSSQPPGGNRQRNGPTRTSGRGTATTLSERAVPLLLLALVDKDERPLIRSDRCRSPGRCLLRDGDPAEEPPHPCNPAHTHLCTCLRSVSALSTGSEGN
jgi:hypothetical protein